MYYTTDRILEQSAEVSKPVMALVAYKNSASEYYIESHDIDEEGRMLEGAPLSKECIEDLVGGYSLEFKHMPSGKIPPNLLYADCRIGHEKYIWYNPPGRRMMYFSKDLNLENAMYYVPGVVYVAESNRLSIYAFKGKQPLDKLYKAPFFNVTGARVCLGNAKLEFPEEPDFEKILLYWEKKFWNTEFTYLGGNQNPTKNNLFTVTQSWKERFDYSELQTSNITLKSLIE